MANNCSWLASSVRVSLELYDIARLDLIGSATLTDDAQGLRKRKHSLTNHSYSDEMKTKIRRYGAENGNYYAITKILPCEFAIFKFR